MRDSVRRLALLLAALSPVASFAQARILSRDALLHGTGYRAAIDLSEYTPPAEAKPPSQHFEGRLKLTRAGRNGFKAVSIDPSFLDAGHRDVSGLPAFDFEYVQDGADLIPKRRGTIPGDHPSWEIILEPGRVWDDAGDGGYSRASLPFTLEERNANCMHNGVLTFLFKSDGRISNAAWQIGSETCLYEKFDAWGWLAAAYIRSEIPGAKEIAAAHRAEVTARMTMKPIAQLATDYPGADPKRFGSVQEVAAENMTLYGFVIGRVHYTGGCRTRHGVYPFCEVMDLPSYSLAKSLVGGIALMRLERLYPGVSNRLIRDYVPQCAVDDRWADVTFANTLDMATGLYRSSVDQEDENSAEEARFFFPTDHESKIRFACSEYSRKAPTGTQWVYHTSDTYALGTAMNRFIKERRGPAADFYSAMLVPELWAPLKLSPSLAVTRRTYDDVAQPFTGYGLTLHRDDIAKLATFLSVDEGRIDGQEMLDGPMLNAALQNDADDRGLRGSTGEFRYHNGFWAYNAAHALGCKDEVWIPYMSGFGGLQVVMLPNGTVYYYVSDGREYRWAVAAAESNRIKRFCSP